MSLLEVKGLSVRFGGLTAVEDLSFELRAGQIKGLIGPNGAGKTTLFNAIAGIVSPSGGQVLFDGMAINRMRPYRRAGLRIARSFQNLQIFQELTVLENVMIGCHPFLRTGFSAALLRTPAVVREEAAAERLALQQLKRVGLADCAEASAAALSFGEGKLLEIARALTAEPRLLLLDEPAAGLPQAEQLMMTNLIRRVNADGVTVLLIEHNMRMVMSLCDEVLVLNQGRRLAEGVPTDISRHPDVIAAYLGEEAAHA